MKSSKAKLEFQEHHNSFTVKILNMESLLVAQIQEFEFFVKERNGIFDFNNYSFTIQKRITFTEFTSLLQHLNIQADTNEVLHVSVNKPRISFGQYKGMFYEDLDDSYISWLKTNYKGIDRVYIDTESKKRGI